MLGPYPIMVNGIGYFMRPCVNQLTAFGLCHVRGDLHCTLSGKWKVVGSGMGSGHELVSEAKAFLAGHT